jgi:5'-nucleotidase
MKKPTKSAIRTFTGELFDFVNPESTPLSIESIAHSLSLICRFTGHCRVFYSVAEHAYRVSYVCPEKHAFWGLMHDAGESCVQDLSRPLKHMKGMGAYRAHEKHVMNAICKQFGMDSTEPPEVKDADNILLVTEQRDLMNNSIPDFDVKPLIGKIEPVTSHQAEILFLRRFKELTKK